jgi:PAS domain-containing protein
MDDTIFASVYLGDARLAAHAVSATPVWLWSTDGTRILWANPAGCAALGAKTPQALLARRFAVGDGARTHIERLAETLPDGDGARLFRLRGFAGAAWSSLTCSCARFDLGRTPGILVIATEPVGADMALAERVRRLGFPEQAAVAAFGPDGAVLFATSLAERRLAGAPGLEAIGAAGLAGAALAAGSARGNIRLGAVILQRIGRGASTVLLAEFLESAAARSAVADAARPAAQQPANRSVAAPDGRPALRRHPLRFVWRMDTAGRFSLGSEPSADIVDTLAGIVSGRPWHDINAELGLDPTGRVAQAIASRETWSNIAISWPVDGSDERLEVELAGLPSFDRGRNFTGYRGFGVCRDVARIERLAALRRLPATAPSPSPQIGPGGPAAPPGAPASFPPSGASPEGIRSPAAASSGLPSPGPSSPGPSSLGPSSAEDPAPVPAPVAPNVVRFPGAGAFAEVRAAEAQSPALSAGERSAFHELTRQLTVRLQTGEPAADERHAPVPASLSVTAPTGRLSPATQVPGRAAAWMFDDARPVFAAEDHPLLNRLPVGILVYRYEELLFANRAFLAWTGYPDLAALRMAGGLDALFLDAGVGALADSGQDGRHLAIATSGGDRMPVDGRLFAIHWDGEQAFAVLLFKTAAHEQMRAAEVALGRAEALASELGMLLDRVADAILVVDRAGAIVSGHGGGMAFFGRGGHGLVGTGFESLFAPDARAAAAAHLARVAGEGGTVAAELTALAGNGELRPMMVTIARIEHGQGPWGQGPWGLEHPGPGHGSTEPSGSEPGASRSSGTRSSGTRSSVTGRLSVVLRDMSAVRQAGPVDAAALLPGTAALESAGALANLCHEARGPIRSILEFCDIMLAERFGPIGIDRYRDCIRDISTAGTQVLSRLADAAGLAEIIAGTSRLSVVRVSLNEAVNACVTVQQGAANEARVVIRTALSPGLPPVLADAEAVRAMTVALLLHALQTTRPGGQVIVSTGRAPGGFVVLRVRDNGEGLNEKAIEAALRPSPQPLTDPGEAGGLTGGLALAKALADANQAHFAITSKPHQGSLFEVTFAVGPASEAPVPDRQARDDPGMTPVDGNQKH